MLLFFFVSVFPLSVMSGKLQMSPVTIFAALTATGSCQNHHPSTFHPPPISTLVWVVTGNSDSTAGLGKTKMLWALKVTSKTASFYFSIRSTTWFFIPADTLIWKLRFCQTRGKKWHKKSKFKSDLSQNDDRFMEYKNCWLKIIKIIELWC